MGTAGIMKFLTRAPAIKRILVGVALGVGVFLVVSLVTWVPSLRKVQREAKGQKEQQELIAALRQEEAAIKGLIQQVQEQLRAVQIAQTSDVKDNADVRAIYENMAAAVRSAGVKQIGQLDKPAEIAETADGQVKTYQPMNLSFSGNYQSVIWLFKEAVDKEALPLVNQFELKLASAGSYPDLSGSAEFLILKGDEPAGTGAP